MIQSLCHNSTKTAYDASYFHLQAIVMLFWNRYTSDALVEIDPRYYRPTEVELLLGDPNKAKGKLGWEAKVGLRELVKMMVDVDIGGL